MHYESNAALPPSLIKKVASALKDAFSLKEIVLISDKDGKQLVQKADDPEYVITDCTGEPLPEDIPLPPEPPLDEYAPADPCCEFPPPPEPPAEYIDPEMDPEYLKAMETLYGDKKDDSMLWGKKVKESKARPLVSIIEEENNVVVEGTFVKTYLPDGSLESFVEKETKTGSVIISFSLYDGEGGITVKKVFSKPYNSGKWNHGGAPQQEIDPKKDAKEFKNLFKVGMKLRIQGDVQIDKFSQEIVFLPVGIKKIEGSSKRMDNADVKRVELHCHTKMSKMDAVTPMKDLVKQAIKWGHKALAITDHGVVQAFPFCFDEVMDEKSDLKLIYGMEGYLMADHKLGDDSLEQEAGDVTKKSKAPKKASYHIIILAKNETGLRNLYKLVSISHLRYLYKRPLLPREVISEHREGLIIGSACEAGELYRAILSGASEEELIRIASFYDYLEIQP
ncbi:MAG: PHP domain-containing protein, partial [Phascolarctobacterium sp.]|nr:PHP domain-containing protein [Phascolarctobacterium sp.]